MAFYGDSEYMYDKDVVETLFSTLNKDKLLKVKEKLLSLENNDKEILSHYNGNYDISVTDFITK